MTWLEENVLDHDLIGSLSANEMDADTLSVTAHETVSFSSFGAPGNGVYRGTPKPPEKPLTRI
jgi:carbamate kinase